ncbi:hypothetical protein D3C77_756590 [compost metagenome]
MLGILGRIRHLQLGERALQPVGAGFALGQFDIQHLLHQTRIAHGETDPQVTRRQLGVVQRGRQRARHALEDFQVFATGVQHLDHGGIVQ